MNKQTHDTPAPDLSSVAHLFSLMGDPTRLRILAALADEGDLCVSDLAGATSVSQSAVSHQLRLLRAANLVRTNQEGRYVFYHLNDDRLAGLIASGRDLRG